MNTAVWVLLGAAFGWGLVMIGDGFRRRPPGQPERTSPLVGWLRRLPRQAPKLTAAAAAGLVVAVVTGWPVAGLLAAAAVATLPALLGPDREHRRDLQRVEALAGWCELLRDTLAAAAGLQQTIIATAETAPAPLRAEVTRMASRLRDGQRLPDVLRRFAAELDDPLADMVVAALLLASDRPSANLAGLLGELASTAREQAAMRNRVAASRARLRTSARSITAITVLMVVGLALLNRDWMAPYDTAAGQIVMGVAGVMFALGLVGLRHMSLLPQPPRLLPNPGGGGPQ